jgi:hypothetical protein
MGKLLRWALILTLSLGLLGGCATVAERFSAVTNWFGGSGDVDTNLNKRVVIIPFASAQPTLAPHARALQEAVENSFRSQDNISLRTFRDLQRASIEFGATELMVENRYLIGARYLGVNLIVMGQISALTVEYDLQGIYGFRDSVPQLIMEGQLRLVDVLSATMVGYQNFRESVELDDVRAQAILTGSEPEPELIEQLIKPIIENNSRWPLEQSRKVPWSGMVLEAREDQVLITVGADSGFKVDDTLVLYSRSTPIPSGAGHDVYLLGDPIGTVAITQIMEDNSWARVTFNRPEGNQEPPPQGRQPEYKLEPGQLVLTR